MSMLFQYQPGTTVWHRMPAGWKLLGLIGAALVVVALHGPIGSGIGLATALVITFWSGQRPGKLVRTLRWLLVMLLVLGAFQIWQSGWLRAVETVGDLLTLVLLATVVTATTATDQMLEVIARALQPLRPVGVHPERVALTFSLTLRMIPLALDLAAESRDAARARGLERDPRARLIPVVVRMVAHARTTGDALWARAADEPDPGRDHPIGPDDSISR